MISVKTTRSPRPRTSNESLRVVHVTGATGREGAGVTAAVEGMVAGLGTRPMVELSLVGICRPGEAWEARADFPARRIRVACRPPRIFSYAPGLQRLMDDLRPDIVHQHGIWQYSGIVSARMREARGVPLIVSPHGMLAPRAMAHRASRKRLAWWLYQRRALEAADMFHVTSERERDDVRALGLRQPVAVVPFGIDVPEACPIRTNSGPLTALFLSRIHPIKGILDLVQAWGQVRPAGWRLMIAGPDECGHTAEVAAAMAEGAIHHSRAHLAVSITGIAGPGGGSADKPVGLVHFARTERGGATLHHERRFEDTGRAAIRRAALDHALRLLEEIILK